MMHVLTILLLIFLGILILFVGILAFIALSIYFTLQPILQALGKVSMGIEVIKFVKRHWKRHRDSKDDDWER